MWLNGLVSVPPTFYPADEEHGQVCVLTWAHTLKTVISHAAVCSGSSWRVPSGPLGACGFFDEFLSSAMNFSAAENLKDRRRVTEPILRPRLSASAVFVALS
jgi:hypothetical protein